LAGLNPGDDPERDCGETTAAPEHRVFGRGRFHAALPREDRTRSGVPGEDGPIVRFIVEREPVFHTDLTELQCQLLSLLGVTPQAFQAQEGSSPICRGRHATARGSEQFAQVAAAAPT